MEPMAKRGSEARGVVKTKQGSSVGKAHSSSLAVPSSSSTQGTIIQRVLSASRKKSSALHNVIYELQQQCTSLSIENRDLKRNARMYDRDLRKLDEGEAQLPALLKKHSNEVAVLQEKYKKNKEMAFTLSDKLKKTDFELLKTKDKLKEYESIINEKNLGERVELKEKVENLEKVVQGKDAKISELNRTILLQKKAHTRMMKNENEKHEKTIEQCKLFEEEQKKLLTRIGDLEKALDVTNIYSRRKMKDGNQSLLLSPEHPIAPILKKFQEENIKLIETLTASSTVKEENTLEGDISLPPSSGINEVHINESDDKPEEENISNISLKDNDPVITNPPDDNVPNDQYDSGLNSVDEVPFAVEVEIEKETVDLNTGAITEVDKVIIGKMDNIDLNKEASPTEVEENSDISNDLNFSEDEELHAKLDRLSEKGLNIEASEGVDERQQNLSNQVKDEAEVVVATFGITMEREEEVDGMKNMQLGTGGEEQFQDLTPESVAIKTDEVSSKTRDDYTTEEKLKKTKQLLLAKMQAIDQGVNPNEVSTDFLKMEKKKVNATKKPIFLQSSPKLLANGQDQLLANGQDQSPVRNEEPSFVTPAKPNSGSAKSLRLRHVLEEELPARNSARRESWEFRNADENLHKGLPAYPIIAPSLAQRNKGSDSSNSPIERSNFNKNPYDEDETLTPFEIDYSPTLLDSSAVPNKKHSTGSNGKAASNSLFDQYDDPFRTKGAVGTKDTPGTLAHRDKQEPSRTFNKSKKHSTLSSSEVVDDLEEMFIL